MWLPKYEDVDRSTTDTGATALPGRIISLSHPVNTGTVLALPDREHLWPDVATVCSSGVGFVKEGDVIVLKPDSGSFWKKFDGREARISGVGRPWWECLLGFLTETGFHPGPGYALVERERPKQGGVLVKEQYLPWGTCLESVGDGFSDPLKGERVKLNERCWELDEEEKDFYTFFGYGDGSLALQWAEIASKKWLFGL